MLRALGMSYYSIRFVDAGEGVKNVMKLSDAEIRRLRELHEQFEVQVSSIGSPIGKIKLLDQEDGTRNVYVPFEQYLKEDVPRAIEVAHAFSTKLIRGFSFYPPKEADPWQYVEMAADRVGQVVAKCQEAGVIYGLEVESNLVGRNGTLLRAIREKINSDHLYLIFDGCNVVCQGYDTEETYHEYLAMKPYIGWLHIKDYRRAPSEKWEGYVQEDQLSGMVTADRGDAGHERILRDFKGRIPALTAELQARGVPGVFLDLEPHLKGGGQFGGFSGPDGFGAALRALCRVLDYVGIGYHLTQFGEWRK
ncbi:MAG: sugar phosphate isomerase/epimerase [Armatimonadetes bacterium]|nr:sugar phosphate isomerase/epimerase [Armatimonadota bacterium]